MECLMAIGTWITGKIADYTVAPVGHKLGYIIHYKRNVGNLISETQDLNLEKKRMEDLVDDARRNGEEIYDHVNDWLSKVGEITKEAEKLLGDENHTDIKCTFRGSFQNLVQRYRLGRKAEKMRDSVIKIKGEVRSDSISYRPKLRSNFRNKDFINFDTRKEITKRIMEALEDGNVKMVGVYGMPGAGKTTLVKEIAKEALDKRLFNDAVVITVSQTPNLKNIQRDVAEKLDLKLDKESIGERSRLLQNRLKHEEKFLIILDDVWNNELNLEDVGIVFEGDDQKGIKILLTSRSERVLNCGMGVPKSFLIDLLSKDEAWDLFSNIVGDLVKNPDFQKCGEEIVEECACLPIAIVTIAHALKNRALHFWRDALGQLQRSNPIIKEMDEKVYSPIKLCYDYLQNEQAQLLLLLCCLHKEDDVIQMEYLMRCGIGLDIFKGVGTVQGARDRVYSLVDHLKDRCLLLDGGKSDTVKMHDVIRDAAILIAKDCYMYFFSDSVKVEECKRRKTLEDSRAISLTNDCVSELICESFEYKQLELIWMAETESDTILNNFLEKTKELRVLCFFSQNMEVLPPSLRFLQNLRTLRVAGYELDDIALIGELKNLEILDLSGSFMEELPTQIGQLTRLRVLDLRGCNRLRVIHPNIISHLTRLEELYMDFENWDKHIEVVNGEKRNASLLELKHLVRLTSLQIRVPDIRMLSRDLFSETLERYKILIEVDYAKVFEEDIGVGLRAQISPSRYLAISKHNESISLHDYGLETLLRMSHVLHFSELQGVNNIVYELDKEGFQELRGLSLKRNDKIRYLINTMERINCSAAFASLESLWLVSLTNLESISHGELAAETFKKLSTIKVSKCDRLKTLLPLSNATQLEKIEIKDCQMMEEIVTHEIDDEEEEEEKIVDELPHLCSLKLVNVTKLRKFCSKKKRTPSQIEEEPLIVDSTMPFFDGKFVSFPKLKELRLDGCDFTRIWDDQFQQSSTSFRNLTTLVVRSCNFMKNLFSSAVAVSLEQLCSLDVSGCRMMEETMTRNESMDKLSFPKLRFLALNNLPNLVSFSSGIFIGFPVLDQLYIKGCPAFETFISNTEQNSCTGTMPSLFNEKFVSFPKLKELRLDGIWDDQFQQSSTSFRNLTTLVVQSCDFMKNLFSSAVAVSLEQLCSLDVSDCRMMEETMTRNGSMDKMSFPKLNFLTLNNLPNLVSFSSGISIEFPVLDQLDIYGCPAFETFISNTEQNLYTGTVPSLFNEKAAFPSLNKLVIRGMDKLRMIWQYDDEFSAANSFCKLKDVTVINCKNLMKIIPSSMQRRLHNVTRLYIQSCDMVEEIFEIQMSNNSEEAYHAIPAQLTHLSLFRLAKLTFVWSKNPQATLTFPNLEKVVVHECPSLESIFPPSIAKGLFQLKALDIYSCGIEEVVAKEEGLEKAPLEFVFQQLGEMQLKYLPNLVCFYPGLHTSSWPLLTRLCIIQCTKVKLFPSKFIEETNVSADCETFPIQRPSFFTKIWDDPLVLGSTSFRCLEILEVDGCEFLTSLFPSAAMAASLEHLHSIKIRECGKMEEIIISRIQNIEKLSFYKLKCLNLRNLPSLVRFSSEIFIEFPVLEELSIQDCAQFGTFISKSEENSCTAIPSLFNQKFVSFPKLKKLEILGCHSKKIWFDQPVPWSTSFHNLTNLVIIKCEGLKNLFSYAISASFEQLCFLEVRDCTIMEEIVVSANERMDKMSFPKLELLKLKNLPNLVRFSSANFIEFPQLTELSIKGCSQFGTFISISEDNLCTDNVSSFFNKFVSFPILENLKLSGCHFIKIWDEQLLPSSLSLHNLKKLTLDKCSFLKNLFSFTIALSLERLRVLRIRDCKMMEEIMSNNEMMEKVSFPIVKCLELENLPNLAAFSSAIFLEFPLLKRLFINDCPELKGFISKPEENFRIPMPPLFNEKIGLGLPNMMLISQQKLTADFFGKLEEIKVFDCKSLTKMFSSNILRSLHNLSKLVISNCDMLEEIFEVEISSNDRQQTSIHLKELRLEFLPNLKHIWSRELIGGTLDFQDLQRVYACECQHLKYLFPPSVAKNLLQLRGLSIKNCRIEQIIAKEKDLEAAIHTFVFPDLELMLLENLPNLVCFYPGLHTSSWPSLKKLDMFDCMKVKEFASELLYSFQEADESAHYDISNQHQPLFSVKKVGLPSTMLISQDQLTEDSSFGKLEEINVCNCKSLTKMFSYNILRRLQNLSKLEVSNCEMMEEVFDIQSSNNHQETSKIIPIHLRELRLTILPKLKHVWSKDPQGTFTFQDLKSVDACQCQGLKNLFPPSVAKSFPKLQRLHIINCGIEEIVAMEEGVETEPNKFVVPQLELMELVNLPNLVSFYPGPHTSSWPSLRKIDVVDCMKVKVFASELCFSSHEEHELAHLDIPNQLHPLFSVEKVGLGTPRVTMISQDQLTAGTFGKLKEINVYGCKSLTKMFSSNILRRLHNLSKLVISNCEMMEEVFEIETSNDYQHDTPEATVPIHLTMFELSILPKLKHVWSNDPRGTFTFQDIQVFDVNICQSLKILFPASVAKNLLRLQSLGIRNCGIEQIVAKEEGQDQAIPMFVFPQLNALTLHNLPQLMCFYPGLHALRLPLLRWLRVSNFMKAKVFSLKFLCFQDKSRLIDHENISSHEHLLSIDKVTSSSQCEDPIDDQEECAGTLSCLSGLRLYDMPHLLHLREESSQPQAVFKNLIDLDILRCGRIKKLVPSFISFQNLMTLKIGQCHGMPSLLTSQTARSMAQLQCLIIFNCKRIAEIIVDAEEGEDIEGGEIIFARLQTLILDCLPSLTSFYTGKYMLGFPDLEIVAVSRCFELQSFSQHGHIVSTPKLHKLVIVGPDHEVIDDTSTIMAVNTPMDLNTTIPELWKSHPCTTLQELFSEKDLAPSNLSV